MIAENAAVVPESAALIYAVCYALDATPVGDDVSLLILQGKGLTAVDPGSIAPGRERYYWFDAGATFLRSWARHAALEADRTSLIGAAESLEMHRDTALYSAPRSDA